MSSRRLDRLALCLFTAVLSAVTFLEARGQSPTTTTLRIRFGMKDKEPTDWSGKLETSRGKVESITGWKWAQNDSSNGNSWTARTRRATPQNAEQRKRVQAGQQLPINENGLLVTLSGATDAEELKFNTQPAKATFKLGDLEFDKPLVLENGNVLIERVPSSSGLVATSADEDYPVTAVGPDGTVYLAYIAFKRGRDFQGHRERVETKESKAIVTSSTPIRRIEVPGDLAYLAQPAGGETLYLRAYREGRWSEPVAVNEGKEEIYRPAIAVAGDGRVWVFYSAHLNADENLDHGNWELLARSFGSDLKDAAAVINISGTAGTDFMPAAATDSAGKVWVTWVGARKSGFRVFAARQEGKAFSSPQRVSESSGNEWEPAIAADKAGNLAIAWDTFDKGDYDVYVSTREGDGKLSPPQAVSATLAFEVRPSLAYDHEGRLWIAYESSGDQWGKDFGALKKKGIPLYQTGRSLQVRVRDRAGKWFESADVMDAMPDATGGRRRNPNQVRQPMRNPVTTVAPTYPRLTCDKQGHVCLAFRGKPGGNWRVQVGSVWCEYLTRLDRDGWADAVWIPHSNNILDNRPALISTGNEAALIVYSGDGRGEDNPLDMEDVHLPGASDDEPANKPAAEANAQPRRGRQAQADPNNNLFYASISLSHFGPSAGPAVLTAIEKPVAAAAAMDVASEREDIQRMRDYRVKLGTESLRIYRGEFHRHTELSPDGGGDGGLLDMWRYAIDAACMDWIGDGDHDYGVGREYSWWTTQKAVTLFTLPESFVPVYSYERSVPYPEGHRNCMFASRGVRSLPRLPLSSPDKFEPAPDTNLLYMYLHYFHGVCASHTSATDMGTDWRNHDPAVEPFVEIFQGDRNNYERPDAPRTAVTEARLKQSTPEKESIGGWRPKGFVNLALLKGYRLAFESSSDHISTHLSYCNVYVTEPTRAGIVDAIRKRRVYGATDNIVADVRCQVGDKTHFMGEEFTTTATPTIDVRIVGTQKMAKVVIIKDDEVVHVVEPGKKEVQFQWTDPKPSLGKTSYYYVRGEQESDFKGASGELVWASPMWIRVESK